MLCCFNNRLILHPQFGGKKEAKSFDNKRMIYLRLSSLLKTIGVHRIHIILLSSCDLTSTERSKKSLAKKIKNRETFYTKQSC